MKKLLSFLLVLCWFTSGYAQDKTDLRKGIEAYKNNDPALALEHYDRYIENNPDDSDALYLRAIVYYEYDKYNDALSDITHAIRTHTKKTVMSKSQLYHLRAKIYDMVDNYDAALVDYNAALRLSSQDVDILCGRAQLFYNRKDYALSDKDYNEALRINPNHLKAQIGLARNKIEIKQFQSAIDILNQVEKMDDTYGEIYRFRCEAYYELGDSRKAVDDLIKYMEIAHIDNFSIRRLIDYSKQIPTYATARLGSAIAEHPDDWELVYVRGKLHSAREKYELALIDYIKVKESREEPNLSILYDIGICYKELGLYLQAIDAFDQANAVEENADVYTAKADTERLNGDYEASIRDFTKAIELAPMNGWTYYRRGWVKEHIGDKTGALEDYNAGIEIEPDYLYTYLNRGKLYLNIGKIELANKDFNYVVNNESKEYIGNCKQYALFYLSRETDAIEYMNTILENRPTSRAYYDATCLYSIMNKPEQALKYLKIALEKGYRDFIHMDVDEDLDNIRNLPEYNALIEKYRKTNLDISSTIIIERDTTPVTAVVPMKKLSSGVFEIPCKINNLPLKFILDTGASDISISSLEATFMLKNGYLNRSDILGRQNYQTASGEIMQGTKIKLRNVSIGEISLKNIEASVVHNQNAPLLFGQSALTRFGKVSVDNKNSKLIFTKE
ncbi:tetratricopeptide repeat protein [Alistipes intestinihominis]|uniref:Tetratricopeptide repeat protein n=1 Tax=Alistipes intestinihominis TaxID=3133172 RepID=A0ABV1GXD3_9BACT